MALGPGDTLNCATGLAEQTRHQDGTKKSADAAAQKNALAAAAAGKEQASIVLRGYPMLKAKTTLEITGVGKGSGVWYCKRVVQQWSVDHGYITNAVLTRGEGGGGGGSGGNTSGGTTPINLNR
jgi:phage protein D